MIFRLFLVAAAVAAHVGMAAAGVVGDAEVPYSATRVVTIDGKSYEGKVFSAPGVQRQDVNINGIAMTFILNIADGNGAVVVPSLGSYVDFPLPPLMTELDRRRLDHYAMGEERIGGMRATKYRIDYTANDGTRGEGFIWLSRNNILLRIEGRILRPRHRPMAVSMRLEDLELEPQRSDLFRIGRNLHELPYEALQALLNLRLPRSHSRNN